MSTCTKTGCNPSLPRGCSRTIFRKAGSCLALFLLTFFFSLQLSAQFATVDFHQVENDKSRAKTYDINWVNGILNFTHTDYFEGMGVPQRVVFTGIRSKPGDVHTLTFQYLAEKSGAHAYDFPISWDQAIKTALRIGNNSTNELAKLIDQRCLDGFSAQGKSACDALNLVTGNRVLNTPFPDDIGDPTDGPFGNVNGKIHDFEALKESGIDVYGDRTLELRGNEPILNANIEFLGYQGSGKDLATYKITWTSASSIIMMRFAGRLASGTGEFGYGEGLGAGSVNGGPYHFKLMQMDGFSTGSQDNQIQSNAVQIPPVCNFSGPTTACTNTSITFTAQVVSGATYAFSITNIVGANPTPTSQSGSSNTFTVNVGNTGGTFTVNLTTTTSGGSTACTPINVCVKGLPAFIDPPGDITVSCTDANALSAVGSLSVSNGQTGACGISATVQGIRSGTFSQCGGTLTETWSFTDDCDRVITHSRKINVSAVPAPTFATPSARGPIACSDAPPAPTALSYSNGQTGACAITGEVMSTIQGSHNECGGSYTESWTFTDNCGHTITASRTINVNQAPAATFATPGARGPLACSDAPPAPTSLSYSNGGSGSCSIAGSVMSTIEGSHNACGGSYTERWSFTDNCGRTINASRTITVNPAPEATFTNPPGNITATVCNAAPQPSSLSYSNGLTGDCGISGSVMSTITGGDGNCGIFTETWTFTDDCGRKIDHARTITVPCCAVTFCSYTQGYYGNKNGNSCDGATTYASPVALMTQLLQSGDIVVGSTSGKYIRIPGGVDAAASAAKVNSVMPGGGTANTLPAGTACNILSGTCFNFSGTTTTYLTKQGKINNVLLSQTITLSLNSRINSQISDFPIQAGNIVTQERVTCNNDDPLNLVSCEVSTSAKKSFPMNANVAAYLTHNGNIEADVADLLALANDLLGGIKSPGQALQYVHGLNSGTVYVPTYAEATSAVDAINNAFDKCRTSLGYDAPLCPVLLTNRSVGETEVTSAVSELKVAAYPNPYNHSVNFNFTAPLSGKALLEVYDVAGRRLAVVFQGQVDAGIQKSVLYKVPSSSRVPMIYKLTIGDKTSYGKLLPGNTD